MADPDVEKPLCQDVDGILMPGGFSPEAVRSALRYKPKDDDLFIATYPKCGTTWTQQIVSLIFNKGHPTINYQQFLLQMPFLEFLGAESAEGMDKPGSIKTHLPFNFTPYSKKARYLCVVRNPKDTLVSYYHHVITDPLFQYSNGNFDIFFDLFMKGEMAFGDYFDHILGWYEHRNDANVLFFTYEELKRDTKNFVLKIAKFMGEEWLKMIENDENILEAVLNNSTVSSMGKVFNQETTDVPEINPEERLQAYTGYRHKQAFIAEHKLTSKLTLVRQGNVGGWKKTFSEEQVKRMDKRIEEKLRSTDLYIYWKSINCL